MLALLCISQALQSLLPSDPAIAEEGHRPVHTQKMTAFRAILCLYTQVL